MTRDRTSSDLITISPSEALKSQYKIRVSGPSSKYYEIQLPREIVEREAEQRGITVQEFLKKYKIEALYDGFPGVHYRFVLKDKDGS